MASIQFEMDELTDGHTYRDQKKAPLTVLSFGGGQDSSAILGKLLNDRAFWESYVEPGGHLLVVMSDTGDEHPHTYEHVERVRNRLDNEENITFKFITTDDGFHLDSWPDVRTPQLRDESDEYERTLVQLGTKSCTHNLKIAPIYKYIDEFINERENYGYTTYDEGGCRKRALKRYTDEHGLIRVLIGFAADEDSRKHSSLEMEKDQHTKQADVWQKGIIREFPLIDHGLDRTDCQRINQAVWDRKVWPSNCQMCPYQHPAEILWQWRNNPEVIYRWATAERKKLENHDSDRKNHGIFNDTDSIWDKLEQAEDEYGHLSDEQLDDHKMNHGCATNAF